MGRDYQRDVEMRESHRRFREELAAGEWEIIRRLTAKEIEQLSEIASMEESANATLKVALNAHANRVSEARSQTNEFWRNVTGDTTVGGPAAIESYSIGNDLGMAVVVKRIFRDEKAQA